GGVALDGVEDESLIRFRYRLLTVSVSVLEVKVGRFELDALAVGHLRLKVNADALVRLDAQRQPVALEHVARRQREHQMWRAVELNDHLAEPRRQPLARTQVERNAAPAPVVNLQAQGHKRRRPRVRLDTRVLQVAVILSERDVAASLQFGRYRDRVKHL